MTKFGPSGGRGAAHPGGADEEQREEHHEGRILFKDNRRIDPKTGAVRQPDAGRGGGVGSPDGPGAAGGVSVMGGEPGTADAVTAARAGSAIHSVVRMHAPKGWRLLDMNLMSNQPIPLRNQQVTVEVRAGLQVLSTTTATVDANGGIDVLDNAQATNVRVIDRFGNSATVNL